MSVWCAGAVNLPGKLWMEVVLWQAMIGGGREMKAYQQERPTIVCLCGSTRFGEMFRYVNQRETLAGKIVLAPGCFQGDVVLEVLPGMMRRLDVLHFHKIALADEILVVNVGGYVGEATRREIAYARKLGKRVRWLESDECSDEEGE